MHSFQHTDRKKLCRCSKLPSQWPDYLYKKIISPLMKESLNVHMSRTVAGCLGCAAPLCMQVEFDTPVGTRCVGPPSAPPVVDRLQRPHNGAICPRLSAWLTVTGTGCCLHTAGFLQDRERDPDKTDLPLSPALFMSLSLSVSCCYCPVLTIGLCQCRAIAVVGGFDVCLCAGHGCLADGFICWKLRGLWVRTVGPLTLCD